MENLRLITSNRLEILAERLADALRRPPASPLDPEVVLVQSRGMERWLSLELARHHGVCANVRFPFPNAFIRGLFQKVFSWLPDRSPFDPDVLTWRIMGLLPGLIQRNGFEGLHDYLGDGGEDLRRLQISGRIADLFDQYLLYRPEMMFAWERGEETHWQARLWRELVRGGEGTHRAALAERFHSAIRDPLFQPEGLPERVSVFGISVLPGFHIHILAALSRFTQVHLYLMNPCREYWGDILSRWEMRRRAGRDVEPHRIAEEFHMERGNSLLATMGALARDFFDQITEFEWVEENCFQDPGEEDLLHSIQSQILNLMEPGEGAGDKRAIGETDASVQIHSCHTPMREMEVLRDRLLDLFDQDPGLRPGDVLVMAPDIESYVSYIQAVFDIPEEDPAYIPFSIADRSVHRESAVLETFTAILDLWGSRFEVSRVLALLDCAALRDTFAITEGDLDLIQMWVEQTRIRWGISGESKAGLGLPPNPENTWEAGLERLLLGYALPGEGERLFEGILPYDGVE
ncbi:MAG: exodeoxyribonuclease V subunit gamma, partial [Deltaproteobacteria bacterium]|nr:exodeoxyribonuclease V subunit gamma [Deltaproteobacteria bacterium]